MYMGPNNEGRTVLVSWTRSLIFMNHSTVFVYRISFLFVSLWHPIFFFVFSLPKEGHVHMTMTRCLVFSYVHGTVRTCCLLWGSSRAVCTRSVVARQWCILLVSGFHLVGASRGCRDLVGSSALHACSAGISSASPPRSLARWRLSQLFTVSRATSPKMT